MKYVLSAVVALTLWSADGAPAGPRYQEVKDWPRLPPGLQLGEVAGVDIDAHGHVFVFHRPGRGFDPRATELLEQPAVVELDAGTGTLIASWGARMFLVPHGITVDDQNNIWLTDVGLHQVFKFSHDGRLLLTLGQAARRGLGRDAFQSADRHRDPQGRRLLRVGRLRQQPRRAVRWQRAAPAASGERKGARRRSSATRMASRSAPMATCSSRIGRTRAFRCSTARASSSGNGSARRRPAACFRWRPMPAGRCMSASGARTTIRHRTACSSSIASGGRCRPIGFGAAGDPVFNAVHDLAVGRDGSIYVAETRTKRVVKLRPR